ncbi:HipA N-terminal domain-containing protein [Flavobacterium faecale]|uniref:HipA N-terminal domain-containing protein n=1 Tax=Flavobacterium faecale TaxID=1355330 RepID=UPI003AAB8F3F
MRKATKYYGDLLAGILTETDEGEYIFQYDDKYVKDHPKKCITLTIPVSKKPYTY